VVTNPTTTRSRGTPSAPCAASGGEGLLLVASVSPALARDNGVPVLRAPPLARALFTHAEVGQEIPGALYNAVAEVLAWVYQLRRFEAGEGERPAEPSALPVPADLDPGYGARLKDEPQRRRARRRGENWVALCPHLAHGSRLDIKRHTRSRSRAPLLGAACCRVSNRAG
jgi:flagellar biosynthetic protein FlhB